MSIWSRIRKLLRLKPAVAERVRELTGQRVRLEQKRHEIDRKIDVFEAEERDALKQGAAAKSDAERRQVAGRLLRTRRNLKRMRTQAAGFTQQIDIIGTHIHHLTLSEQAARVELPKAEELTAKAAEAEQAMAELSAQQERRGDKGGGGAAAGRADEGAAIVAGFRQLAERDGAKAPAEATPVAANETAPQPAEPKPDTAAAPPEPERPSQARPAKPEAG